MVKVSHQHQVGFSPKDRNLALQKGRKAVAVDSRPPAPNQDKSISIASRGVQDQAITSQSLEQVLDLIGFIDAKWDSKVLGNTNWNGTDLGDIDHMRVD